MNHLMWNRRELHVSTMSATAETRQRAAADAQRIRERFSADTLPVDPVKIARQLDIEVFDAEMPEGVSGAIEKEAADQQPVIYLSATDHPNRRRFTCAHEIGHYVNNESKQVFKYVDRRGMAYTPDEQYANEFAAYLLMPPEEMANARKRLGPDPGLVEITIEAQRFGVSPAAFRLHLAKFAA